MPAQLKLHEGGARREDFSMQTAISNSAPLLPRRAIHPALVPVPVTLFIGALLTDIAYWRTAHMMWSHFSDWLLAAAIVTGILVAIAIVFDGLTRRPATDTRWPV